MTITFKLFASARDSLKTNTLSIDYTGDILYVYVHKLLELHRYNFTICRFARNSKYIDLTTPIKDGDIISVIPPVSGG